VALSLDIKPESLDIDWRPADYSDPFEECPSEFHDRIDIVVDHARNGVLRLCSRTSSLPHSTVLLSDFAEWAGSLGLSLPDQFPRKSVLSSVRAAPGSADVAEQIEQSGHENAYDHETPTASVDHETSSAGDQALSTGVDPVAHSVVGGEGPDDDVPTDQPNKANPERILNEQKRRGELLTWAKRKYGKDLATLPNRDTLLEQGRQHVAANINQGDVRWLRRKAPEELRRGGRPGRTRKVNLVTW
jgi:hypothetical protein